MRSPLALLRFVAKALLNQAAGGLPVGNFVVDVVPEIAHDVWDACVQPRTTAIAEEGDAVGRLVDVDAHVRRLALLRGGAVRWASGRG